jgi:hypothetical protein
MAALALAGIGIGTTVLPVTSSALCAVPPERSGMAASAANTSREIGALTGVAVLGSLVISRLHSSLTEQLNYLGIRLSARRTRLSTTDCTQRCTCPPGWRWPPGCSPSSPCAHVQPPPRP